MLKQEQKIGCSTFFAFLVLLSLPFAIYLMVVASYFNYLPFKIEIYSVVTIGVIFFIYLLFIPQNAYFSSCKIKNALSDMEEELKDRIRKTLLKIGSEKKSVLKVEKFFEEYFSDVRNENFANVAPTVFPMLGILGTFISIAISMPNFSVSSTEALDKEISLLLDGVGTAFYASIYGIFLSLWWIFFEKRGVSKIQKSIKLVKRAYKKYFWDEITLEHYKLAQNQMHNEELVNSLRENFNIHFMKQFNDSYLNEYKELMEKTRQNFEKISKDIDNITKNLTKDLDDIAKSTNVLDASKNIDQKLDSFNKAVERLDSIIDSSLKSVDKEVADIVKSLADFAKIVVQKSDEVDRSISSYQDRVEKLLKR